MKKDIHPDYQECKVTCTSCVHNALNDEGNPRGSLLTVSPVLHWQEGQSLDRSRTT